MKLKVLICSIFYARADGKPKDTLTNRLHSNVITLSAGFFPIFGVLNAHYVRRVNFLRVGPFKTTYLNGNAGVWAGIKFTGHLAGIGFSGLTDLGKNHFEMGLGAASIIDQIVITTKKTTHLVSQINNRYYLKIILQFGLLLL